MRLTLLFPGQGGQFVGMGRDWVEQFLEARQTFEEAEDLLRLNISQLAFQGPIKALSTTYHSQLAIFITCIAIWRVLSAHFAVQSPVCAGMSLGEFTALVASEKLTFSDALHYVQRRAQLMEICCREVSSGMMAVLGLDMHLIEKALTPYLNKRVWIANDNAPGQVVIAGYWQDLKEVKVMLEQLSARVVPLVVEGAFHTQLMSSAEKALMPSLKKLKISDSSSCFYSGVSAKLCSSPNQIRAELAQQMTQSVLWRQTVSAMELEKTPRAIEVGGKTLTALHRRNRCQSPCSSLLVPSDLKGLTDLLN